ncbi:Ras family protein [Mycena indigotica]|uniref:Ras family protein n=1 Tax=Mycena indigotica TaxID=2126181 RepID=A0A8H6TCF6_9AGAR|nr:Ras family protein [Mycena indigotica]KAF7316250.1 Ras family protein [Mycena indigotica]
MPPPQYFKAVVLGDGAVGKTSLIISSATQNFPGTYAPLCADGYAIDLTVGDKTYEVVMFDTAGGEDYDRLRPLSYPQTDAFLLCFCVAMPASFANIRDRWVPEITHFCPDVPFILVGTQIDLREDDKTLKRLKGKGERVVETAEGMRRAVEVGAARYVECSALTRDGLHTVFEQVSILVLPFSRFIDWNQAILASLENPRRASLAKSPRTGRCIVT